LSKYSGAHLNLSRLKLVVILLICLNLSKFSGVHLNLSKFSYAPFFGGTRLLHNNFQVVFGGHVRLVPLVPSLRSSRLHRANRANKGAGQRNGAHGRARCRGRGSVYARWWDRVRTFVSFTAFVGAAFFDARAGGGSCRRGARGCAFASAAARASPCGNSGGVSAVSSMRQVARA
jgi:hypothetical protein